MRNNMQSVKVPCIGWGNKTNTLS